jgi:MYXO-CTERM domain-containing protein
MYPNTDAGDVEKRSLSADDIAGVCAVYASAGGGCGCGSGGASGAGALLLGALALRGRRARRPGARKPAG